MSFFTPGPPTKAKICGITNLADAELAISSHADALGFNFYPGSKRYIDFEECKSWISGLADRVCRVAVVVNPTADEVAKLRDSGCFEAIQFHGDETPEFCAKSGFSHWIKAVRVKKGEPIEPALAFETKYLLLDAWSATAYGGTGLRLDWDVARDFAVKHADRKVILAGGLTPGNVRDGIRIVRPHAVDVAGGVELESRAKNEYLVREFVRITHSA
jgi:phosphoribosylanthranilate isomerase